MTWADLTEASIVTTVEGPIAEDISFVLRGRERKGCLVPNGALESKILLERLQHLTGFDNEKLIEAMGSTRNARFVCWRRT